MKESKEGFIITRIKSVKYAFKGALHLIKTEASIQVQVSIAVIMTIIGFLYNISATEWLIQFIVIGLLLVAESLNSAIEEIADFIHPEYHKKIGIIKDIGAGAAFFAALIAIISGIIIYFPKVF